MKSKIVNNFDLIRLFAATQVVLMHTQHYLDIELIYFEILGLFPGVPIFFFISGFLIYESYEKSKDNSKPILNFFIKRFLRIFPALWFCLLLTLISIWYAGYFNNLHFSWGQFVAWIISQATIFQFYNPYFMRDYGIGVTNGSLWSISVEIQFYLIAPIFFLFLEKKNKYLITFFLIIFVFLSNFNSYFNEKTYLYQKLFDVSFLPYFYMFYLGAVVSKFKELLFYLKKVPFMLVLFTYIILYYLRGDLDWGKGIIPIAYILLILLIIKCAYSFPHLSQLIVRKTDISYGVYILHMPIINFLVHNNVKGLNGLFIGLTFTFLLAILSWFLVEKKFLMYKKNTLRDF